MAITNPLLPNSQEITNNPKGYFNNALQAIISIFMFVAIIYFIWHFVMGGYHFISSQGDAKKIESAKEELTYAVIGLGVVFSVFAILKFVGTVLNIPDLKLLQISWPSL
jgi:glycerol uptake facilitator-like aquaporin